jgi:signal transduction histidine kinase/CheY-like chemotaxis protein
VHSNPSFWSNLSVRTKLSVVAMAACAAALAMMSAGVVANELVSARAQLTTQLTSVTDVVAANSTAAVQFGDQEAAGEALTSLRGDPSIEAARIDVEDGRSLARYGGELQLPDWTFEPGVTRSGSSVIVSRPILLRDRTIGMLHVQGSLSEASRRLQRYALILAIVVALAGLVAFMLASKLQQSISGPILRLSSVAGAVATDRDYAVRVVKEHNDEIGALVDQFNGMLSTIELRDAELQQARDRLEERVAERTRTLELEIEEHQRTEAQLTLAKAAAEQASVTKSAFVANMSHELRTPLNAIIGYGEMLKEQAEEQHTPEFAADVDRVLTAGRHLLSLINNVLDLSKIEAGRMELDVSEFELAGLIKGVVATSEGLAAARGNTIVLEMAESLGTVRQDRTKLQQILLNLVGNACKFTENGRVQVRAWSERAPGAAETIAVDVRDTGIGMTEEQQGRLFQEFAQADASTTRRYGGTGLGLAISKRLCQLMGGTIAAASKPGDGSTFTVRLPREVTPAAAVEPAEQPAFQVASPGSADAAHPTSDRPTVLVVDDDSNARDLTGRILARAGYRVVTAITANEAWRLLQATPPDAVVLDVILPGRSGWSLLESMRTDPRLARIPVVVTSMLDRESRSLELGALAHLIKPVHSDALASLLRSALSHLAPGEAA